MHKYLSGCLLSPTYIIYKMKVYPKKWAKEDSLQPSLLSPGYLVSPKSPCMKALVPSMGLLGIPGTFKSWGLVREGPQVTGDVPLRRRVQPSLFLFFLTIR